MKYIYTLLLSITLLSCSKEDIYTSPDRYYRYEIVTHYIFGPKTILKKDTSIIESYTVPKDTLTIDTIGYNVVKGRELYDIIQTEITYTLCRQKN